MKDLLVISPSPHVAGEDSVKKIMYGVVIALLPAILISFWYFGLDAVRVTLTAVIACLFFEWLFQKVFLKGSATINDGSALITGILLAFNLPSNLPCWIVIIGALVAIGIGKSSFGGLGNNIFNPALVGRVFLLISFPVQMTSWPVPKTVATFLIDAETGATPLAIAKEALKNGEAVSSFSHKLPDYLDYFTGSIGGSLGEVSAIALILGGVFMLIRKIITWHIPVSMLLSIFIFTGILWLTDDQHNMNPVFHLLTGGVMLGAIFMATDMVTSPMSKTGMIIFGIGIGVITVLIRVYGAYPEGVSFAILIMNAIVPLINRIKPKRFGEVIKNG